MIFSCIHKYNMKIKGRNIKGRFMDLSNSCNKFFVNLKNLYSVYLFVIYEPSAFLTYEIPLYQHILYENFCWSNCNISYKLRNSKSRNSAQNRFHMC